MEDILLLDLEGVLIETWEQPNALHYHIERIKGWLQWERFDRVCLMSYAIHNMGDCVKFDFMLRDPLEQALGIKFDNKMAMHKFIVLDMLRKHTTLKRLTVGEFDDFFQHKDSTLARLALNGAFPKTRLTLIDDNVTGYTMHVEKHSTTLRVINITKLPFFP